MSESDHGSWRPTQLDLTLGLLVPLIFFLGWMHLDARRRHPPQPSTRISLQARTGELRYGAKGLLGQRDLRLLPDVETTNSAWDRAHSAILMAESGDMTKARALALEGPVPPGPAGEAFRRCWTRGYLQEGPVPDAADRLAVKHALRSGYGARLLEARLADQNGQREEAQRWIQRQAKLMVFLGLLILFLVGGGIIFGVFLAMTWQRPSPPDLKWREVPGKAMLLVFLGWFSAFLASGIVAELMVALLPFLAPLRLVLTYGFHTFVGLALIIRVRDQTLGESLRPLFPRFRWNTPGWAAGFLLLAISALCLVTVLLAPVLRDHEPPQKELMEKITGAASLPSIGLMLLMVSVIAPLFEEILFRGTLFPWLEQRWRFRRGWALALLASSLAFGAIHLVPAALPGLSVLGLILGLAFLRTGSLTSAVIIHGVWNGGVFLYYLILMN